MERYRISVVQIVVTVILLVQLLCLSVCTSSDPSPSCYDCKKTVVKEADTIFWASKSSPSIEDVKFKPY